MICSRLPERRRQSSGLDRPDRGAIRGNGVLPGPGRAAALRAVAPAATRAVPAASCQRPPAGQRQRAKPMDDTAGTDDPARLSGTNGPRSLVWPVVACLELRLTVVRLAPSRREEDSWRLSTPKPAPWVAERSTRAGGGRSTSSRSRVRSTESCQAAHMAYIVSGRMTVTMDDGTSEQFSPGDLMVAPPGHDAVVDGDEPCVLIDWQGVADYAKR